MRRFKHWCYRGFRFGARSSHRLPRLRFSQQATSNAQRSLRLLNIDWLGQYEIRANAKGFGNSGLTFDNGNRKRTLIRSGIARTLEQQSGILLIVAIDDDGVEMLRHQLLDSRERLVAGLNGEVEFGQNLGDHAGRFVVRAEE